MVNIQKTIENGHRNSEVVVFAYLMLQVVSMVVEAATGRSRSRTKTIVASATMFVVIMLEFSFFEDPGAF